MDNSLRRPRSKSERTRKHALECLRLAADCKYLARVIERPAVQRHFLRMAEEWIALAEQSPEAEARGLQTLH
jgi:hypothetical protein